MAAATAVWFRVGLGSSGVVDLGLFASLAYGICEDLHKEKYAIATICRLSGSSSSKLELVWGPITIVGAETLNFLLNQEPPQGMKILWWG